MKNLFTKLKLNIQYTVILEVVHSVFDQKKRDVLQSPF